MSMDNKAELITDIQTTILRRGLGNKLDPIRIVTQYWTTDGRLLEEEEFIEIDGVMIRCNPPEPPFLSNRNEEIR
jgi:hypothetical protein